ncbi:MuDRA-like transposase [Cucumis melo var. makuwa]|uniref:MuDRA-like transposase n=1 Tax=Cucumis melo var. makuwa TaxID=1194695 RepID=A0A5A7TPS9_CUCMM|nr:MuDRA-like transposase [Cucumis melo var. makuwa]
MPHVRILVRYGGAWDEGRRKYEGGVLKGIVVPKEITHKDLQYELYDLAEVDPTKFDIKIRCIYEIKGEKEDPPFELSNDRDLKFYILSENPLEVPLYLSFEPTSNRSMKVLNKDYNSVFGSNQVQNLNIHPPIGMDTLDENEVDIGEVQVGLCDNMIGTNSAIWESYESYHSKDDTFTWESVEMYNELFDIPEQRDASTKDCKGKGKVDYRQAKSWVVGELIKSKFKGPDRIYKPLALCELAPLDQTVQIVNEESQLETTKKQVEIQKNDEAVTLVEKEPVTVPDKDEQEKPIKRRKLCKIENKKVQDEDEQGNPPTTSTQIISESTKPVLDVEIREVDTYNSMWQVDPKLWKEYLQWKRSRKTTHEQRKVVSTTRKKDFFRQLEENTWVHGDLGINKPDCIVWNHIFDTHLVTPDNKKAEWTDPTAHLTIWTEKDVEYYFNTAVGDYDQIPGWEDVKYVISCINIKEHWLAIVADMRKCKIYVFDSMPNYVEQKLVDEVLQMPTRCIASLAIAIGVNLHSDHFTYGPWPIRRSKATLQKRVFIGLWNFLF